MDILNYPFELYNNNNNNFNNKQRIYNKKIKIIIYGNRKIKKP